MKPLSHFSCEQLNKSNYSILWKMNLKESEQWHCTKVVISMFSFQMKSSNKCNKLIKEYQIQNWSVSPCLRWNLKNAFYTFYFGQPLPLFNAVIWKVVYESSTLFHGGIKKGTGTNSCVVIHVHHMRLITWLQFHTRFLLFSFQRSKDVKYMPRQHQDSN